MKKLKIKTKRKLIKISITLIFVLVCTVLTYQYSVLYGLRKENQQLCKSVNNLENRIEETKEKIQEYKSIMEDSDMLSDYGEHNGYYNTDEIYNIK